MGHTKNFNVGDVVRIISQPVGVEKRLFDAVGSYGIIIYQTSMGGIYGVQITQKTTGKRKTYFMSHDEFEPLDRPVIYSKKSDRKIKDFIDEF